MKTFLYTLVVLALAGCVSDRQNGAPSYPVRLDRKTLVGEQYHVAANGSDEQTMQRNVDGFATPPTTENYVVEFIADGEVLAVTRSGIEQKSKLVVIHAIRKASGRSVEFLPAKTVVIAERINSKTEFSVAGRPVAPEIASALAAAGISLGSDEGANDDEIFGTPDRKQIGDSWPINSKAAAAALRGIGIAADESKISGTTTLVEKVDEANRELLRIAGTMTMEWVSPSLPPGYAMRSSAFTASYRGLFPIDPTKRAVRRGMEMSLDFVFSGADNGKEIVVTLTKKAAYEVQFSSQ